ncbi:MAG: protein translocase subunit SecD [Gammaproteobacteria bacterium]|nr:protein translocase subunit SecD [Gammaproteobacteria bacterium]
MQNKYPWWKNVLLVVLFLIGLLYALPMLYGDDPAIQISAKGTAQITSQVIQKVNTTLERDKLQYKSAVKDKGDLLVRFLSTDTQLKARDIIQKALGNNYEVAINLAPRTPGWLAAIGAQPMKLGLDLRGGVYFLLEVDVDALIEAHEKGDMHSMGDALRDVDIRYAGISRIKPNGVLVRFRDKATMGSAYNKLIDRYRDYKFVQTAQNGQFQLRAIMTQTALVRVTNYAIDQAMNILNNRVNALGVSEAVVQRQGRNHISVELPGIQDTARAKSIIGKVATLQFQLVDEDHDVGAAMKGDVPVGSKLYMTDNGAVLLKDRIILHGDAITYATSSSDQSGRPSVNVRLGGNSEVNNFNRVTANNVGKQMAVVYVDMAPQQKIINGKTVTVRHKTEKVISVATIDSALGNNFEITGLQSVKYAQNLSLLLRSGALLAPINIVQERTVGPSLGKANIHMGILSTVAGFFFIVLFMAMYYRFFGLLADMALFLNLVFIVAFFSILGVTLTLPGIAAMVLTVGMAVDANVLIYERIREELRLGVSPQASIHLGYARAFTTIVDSNVTTLIVALVLFALGSGSVKGFAVTLIVGLLSSMFTSIVYTRAVANVVYGGKHIKKLSIGIKIKKK